VSKITVPKCVDVAAWRVASRQEQLSHLEQLRDTKRWRRKRKGGTLAVREKISPVEMYCYLRARFGRPNGFMTFVKNHATSDNYIHWDYHLRAGDKDLCIWGLSREVQFAPSEDMSDDDWRSLIANIKADFGRVGKEKSQILRSLEKWVIFPNKFVQIANACAELHAVVVDCLEGQPAFKTRSFRTKREHAVQIKELEKVRDRAVEIYDKSLQLSLLTPVLTEAFINMVALMLCKREIKNNQRQFEYFMRQNIDTKVFDLYYKCEGFSKQISADAATVVHFKQIMDRRNHAIHGNIEPQRDMIEVVYFEGKTPLFQDGGDNIGRYQAAMERVYRPRDVIRDYEGIYLFFEEVISCLEPETAKGVRLILEDPSPGYDLKRQIAGALLPHHAILAQFPGLRYDDELYDNQT
jgi:hypothetical protein